MSKGVNMGILPYCLYGGFYSVRMAIRNYHIVLIYVFFDF
jgi:hypothetical protein